LIDDPKDKKDDDQGELDLGESDGIGLLDDGTLNVVDGEDPFEDLDDSDLEDDDEDEK
jgi:hypothetical protein